ncbi:hypothetical protein MBCUT_17590 [Methanobrevibacter cuticularis]|uniref:6-hydroxymethyl-7,8-dihydropterin pyrophosphokinase n=1 Tax=Methanobrevibacter cuticularis TaxID=47311 RepID=A0A166CZU6_9EURY|nr:6-hydroxymethylpterin diphosphokinase MptE-like protein [Methanobrevibacter cuticularis]KZX15049.1 hypothetical protein MBCUT_17590 [Methanobrevibacter cuticularis]
MKFETWNKWYNRILNDFNFSKDDDEKSARYLNESLEDTGAYSFDEFLDYVNSLNNHKELNQNQLFVVFGAGPSLKENIKCIQEEFDIENYISIAADGATTALLEEDLVPDIVVTDLDGKLEDLLSANEKGSFFVLHAHGNNLEEINKYARRFKKVLGTTQSFPHGNLYNLGGFTDGDRAVFLAIELGAKKIILAGMDFGDMTTSYSRPNITSKIAKADEIKQKKLKYAEKLIDWISNNENAEIINLSS